MNKLLELHFIQNFAPSNLNRDDTGAPKDAIFGGTRRGRISSQSFKKAIRDYFKANDLLPKEYIGSRTTWVVSKVGSLLENIGKDKTEAEKRIKTALEQLGKKKKVKVDEDFRTEYLFFLGSNEFTSISKFIDENWDELDKKNPKIDVKKLEALFDGGKAVDVALFGRMLANLPERNADASCQVSHPISTHTIEREFDFFTAIDDIKQEHGDADSGAGMLGTIEFYSSCMYRYISVDLDKLKENLLDDMDIFHKGVEAFLRASALSIPTGKQNSFAAFNPPAYYLSSVKEKAAPRNLTNAFERPIQKKEYSDKSLSAASIERFEQYWQRMEKVFGKEGSQFCLQSEEMKSQIANNEETFESWVKDTMAKVKEIMEA